MKSRILGLLTVGLLAGSITGNTVPANEAPTAFVATYTILMNTQLDDSLVATDPNGDFLTFNVSSPTSGVLIVYSTGSFTYAPQLNFLGLASFSFV